jgi:hypothetical protein
MRHQGGSAAEILGRKLARSDPRSLVGAGVPRWEPPAASRAPSFLAARHRPLCPRLRRGVLTARASFSGACSQGRLRRCLPRRSAAFLTDCAISQRLRRQGSGRHALLGRHSRQPAPGNGRSQTALRTIRRRCAARSPMFSRRPLSSFAGCSYPAVKPNK